MSLETINRRKALTTMGLAGAVALVTPTAVIAANAEDAKLKCLWEEWKAQWAALNRCCQTRIMMTATMQSCVRHTRTW
jgi:hypothetical protein